MGPPSAVELGPHTLNVKFIFIYFNVDYFYCIIYIIIKSLYSKNGKQNKHSLLSLLTCS